MNNLMQFVNEKLVAAIGKPEAPDPPECIKVICGSVDHTTDGSKYLAARRRRLSANKSSPSSSTCA